LTKPVYIGILVVYEIGFWGFCMQMKRAAGILFHPTSLPGKYGIGEMGSNAYGFIDWLHASGMRLWQMLPLNPTGYGDSPYQSFSSFAGNELLISLELLIKDGYLSPDDIPAELKDAASSNAVDFGMVVLNKKPTLLRAASNFLKKMNPENKRLFTEFCKKQAFWLDDYALFMSIKSVYDKKAQDEKVYGAMWANFWPKDLALRDPKSLKTWALEHASDIEERKVLQYFFSNQWKLLKVYANQKGIDIIGDIPIFVAYDSADVWANRDLFLLNDAGKPLAVAGVPPDYFSEDGQLWGNPLFNWKAHKKTHFTWWKQRITIALENQDYIRVDHFRGFESYWAVPFGEKTARKGEWQKGMGRELFTELHKTYGSELPILAEDLGFITKEVQELRDDFGLPGMKILQFAFDAKESGKGLDVQNAFLPHNFIPHSVVYTGTHDNDTMLGWLNKASDAERAFVDRYLGGSIENRVKALIREAFKSVAAFAIIPMQDVLLLDSSARMNTPSTPSGNWTWRMTIDQLRSADSEYLTTESTFFNRNSF